MQFGYRALRLTMKHALVFVSCLAVFKILEAGKSSGPVGTINLDSVYQCENGPTGDEFKITVDLKTDDQGVKTLSGHLDNQVTLDPSIQHLMVVEKYTDGEGWKNYFTQKGSFCDDILKHFKDIWTKVKKAVKPELKEQCMIPGGSYDLVDFQCAPKELGIPSIFYGKFRMKWELFQNGKQIACLQGEGESIAP